MFESDQSTHNTIDHLVNGRDLPWLLRTQAKRRTDMPFLIWSPFEGNERIWTYAAFEADVRRVAAGLAAQGVKPGHRVLIHLENCPELLLSWFACAYLGAIGVLSNTRSVTGDVAYFCELTEAVGAITQPCFVGLIADAASNLSFLAVTETDAGERVVRDLTLAETMAFEQLMEKGIWDQDRTPAPMSDVSIQFTSGTTSRSKAVVWTHANVLYSGQQTARNFVLRTDDIAQVFLPLFHIYALSITLGALWSGGAILLQRKFSVRNFWGPAVKYGATWAPMVPFCVNALLSQAVPAHRFRLWNSVMSPEIEQTFGVQITSSWGMTEMGWSPIASDAHMPCAPGCMGRPAPGIAVSVRRADGRECEAGETGDLYIKGVPGITIFRTYLNNPEAYAESFDEHGWFNTGDRVRIGEEGDLFFADRVKDIIRVGAENVSAAEVEQVILASGWVRECAVVAAPHVMLDEVPVAFVMPVPSAPPALEERLIAYCRERLADFKVIREVHVVDSFPRSTIEKIAKNELRARLRANP